MVIAEGRNSTLAKSIGSENFRKDYQQTAQTFLVEISELNTEEAIQIFYEKKSIVIIRVCPPYLCEASTTQQKTIQLISPFYVFLRFVKRC